MQSSKEIQNEISEYEALLLEPSVPADEKQFAKGEIADLKQLLVTVKASEEQEQLDSENNTYENLLDALNGARSTVEFLEGQEQQDMQDYIDGLEIVVESMEPVVEVKKESVSLENELSHYKNLLRNIDKYPDYNKKNVEIVIAELEQKINKELSASDIRLGSTIQNKKTKVKAKVWNVDPVTDKMQIEDMFGNKEKRWFDAKDWKIIKQAPIEYAKGGPIRPPYSESKYLTEDEYNKWMDYMETGKINGKKENNMFTVGRHIGTSVSKFNGYNIEQNRKKLPLADQYGLGGVILGAALGVAGTLAAQNLGKSGTKKEVSVTKQTDLIPVNKLPKKIRFYDPKDFKSSEDRIHQAYKGSKWVGITKKEYDAYFVSGDGENGRPEYMRKNKSEPMKGTFDGKQFVHYLTKVSK